MELDDTVELSRWEWPWAAVTPGINAPEVHADNEFTGKGTDLVGKQELLQLNLTWKR